MVIVDHHELVDVPTAQGETVGLGVRCSQAVGDGPDLVDRLGLARGEAPVHGVRTCGLHPEHLAPRHGLLDGAADSGAQTTAADRHDHRFQLGEILGHLEPDGGGTEDGVPALERMDDRPPTKTTSAP